MDSESRNIEKHPNVLLELWDIPLEIVKETEMKASIQGVAASLNSFLVCHSLGLLILRHTDNRRRTMQKADMSAAEGREVMSLTTRYFEVTTQL